MNAHPTREEIMDSMSHGLYILHEGKPVKVEKGEAGVIQWGKWYENPENRRVGLFEEEDIRVSTVFLALDHGWRPDGKPVLWETMIFGGRHNQEMWRYTSLEDAKAGHESAVALVKQELVLKRAEKHWL